MRVLFLSAWYPLPADNGSKLRIWNLLRQIASRHDVVLATYQEAGIVGDENGLKDLCREVITVPRPSYEPLRRRALAGLLSSTPRSLVDTYSGEMAAQISGLCGRHQPDVVVASQISMASYASSFAGPPAVFEEAELAVPFEQRLIAPSRISRWRAMLTWLKLARYLRRLVSRFAAVTVVSDVEAGLLRSIAAHPRVAVIPNGVSVSQYEPRDHPEPDTLIFAGSFRYGPNYDAMVWFLRHVFPLVRARIPAVRLTITGDRADRDLPADHNVVHVGHVRDVRALVGSAWVSVAPLLSGGGTRVKILEAMALGTPVVATPKGAEGLRVVHGEHLFVADDAAIFASHVVRLLRDEGLRREMAAKARRLVEAEYDWDQIGQSFEQVLLRAARGERGRR